MDTALKNARPGINKLGLLALSILWVFAGNTLALADTPFIVEEIKVVGSKANVKNIAASAAYIDTSDIRAQSYDNPDRVLRKVPGVYTREEGGGFGLFPNISLRGVDPGRSGKVTIMEDGILAAPATYSAPQAYYSPTTGRMHAIEVLKGSSQIKYGPHTTGGVINYLSTPIPDAEQYYLKAIAGTFGEIRNHLYFGNTIQTKKGRFGFLIENFLRQNDGFRKIDVTTDFRDGTRRTGLKKTEPMVKFSWEPNTRLYQRFEAKFGYTKLRADQGYLGQPENIFRKTPFARLPASRFDRIDTQNFRASIRHFLEFNEDTSLVTTAYGHSFHRNWQKANSCTTSARKFGLGQCLKDPAGLKLLQGQGPGTFTLRNNNRNYYLFGVESNLRHKARFAGADHKFELGLRLHSDQVRRLQNEENFLQDANGAIVSRTDTEPGAAGNRRQKTYSLALHADDRIEIGRFTITPGIRFEQLWQEFEQFAPKTIKDLSGSFNVLVGGGTVNYRLAETTNVFFGAHRGFSPPSPKGHLKNGLSEESSTGYETGVRYNRPELGFSTELIGFWTDFSNLIIAESIGGSGNLGKDINAGAVRSRGVEFKLNYDPAVVRNWSFRNPWYTTATFTDAKILSDVASGELEEEASIFSGAKKGNAVPNIPRIQFAFGTGLQFERFSVNLDGQLVGQVFSTGSNAINEIDPFGNPDARFGTLDRVFLLDLSMAYQVRKNVRIFTNFRNITDQKYLAARLPEGPRSGAPFQAFGGLEMNF
ncbi:MAG: TonB-dependent receptor family protein [Nitrospinales bacterium]